MGFVQKQKENKLRKDILERTNESPEGEAEESPKNKVVFVKNTSGKREMFWVNAPEENSSKNPYLDDLLKSVMAKHSADEAGEVESPLAS